MPRLQPIHPKEATGKARELLDAVQSRLGMTSNLLRTLANAPAALEAYLGFSGALSEGVLSTRLRQQIALTVAQANRCSYSLAAHTAIGKTVGLSEETVLDSRRAASPDSKIQAALQFACQILEKRGRVSDADVWRLRKAGYGDPEISEIVANVALNMFTNYFNRVAETPVDFPKVDESVNRLEQSERTIRLGGNYEGASLKQRLGSDRQERAQSG